MNSYSNKISFCIIILIILAGLDLSMGAIHINILDLFCGNNILTYNILHNIRIPRALTALLVGSSLAIAGANMQAVFRNPLADPQIMGISSGACLGVAVATLCISPTFIASGVGSNILYNINIITAAFIGALISSLILIIVAIKLKSIYALLIFGVIMGYSFSAITSILSYLSNAENLKTFYNWTSGSFANTNYNNILIISILITIGLALHILNNKGLDIILFGEDFTKFAGGNIIKIRLTSIISTCLIVAGVTAFCGPIGFVGIVSAHLSKYIFKTRVHYKLFVPTMVIGAILTISADIISLMGSMPLPVGSTIAIIGIPIVILIMLSIHISK